MPHTRLSLEYGVKQITLLQHDSPLLNFAVSRLDPEVFSHPVWVRFGRKGVPASLNIVGDLLSAAKTLQDEDLSSACQVLLICAIYQNHGGQGYQALRIAQQARSLAEQRGLFKETIWAIWGACAIHLQKGNYAEAVNHLVDLQVILEKQNEWILVDFIDVVKQSLIQDPPLNEINHFGFEDNQASGDLLAYTFNWLLQWGFSAQNVESQFEINPETSIPYATQQSTLSQSFFSVQRWQGHWHTLMLIFKGEVKLHWAKNDSLHAHRQFSFWGSILSSLRLYLSGQNMDTQVIDVPQIPSTSMLLPVKENPSLDTNPRKPNRASTKKKATMTEAFQEKNTIMPVSVHMLGMFSMTIGDLTVKLPASRGLLLLKYLLLHHKQDIPREVLMEVFWPDAEPEMARNNLNVAMHSLRKAMFAITDLPMIIYEGGTYSLAPDLQVWIDVEEFERCVKAGQRMEARNQLTAALAEYEAGISLYQGDLLEQNPYEEWTVLDRERLRIAYLDTLDRLSQIYFEEERYSACRSACQLILMRDPCREDAHCLLMRCYSRQGQHHLALRQYQMCVEALRGELQLEPAPETTQLYNRIRRREQV
jgi:DNA-binding SARP family transcriptional activator